MIPDEVIEQVREAADIVAIIGEYVPLKKTGSDYRGPCPFHQGTRRNFSVVVTRDDNAPTASARPGAPVRSRPAPS